MSFKFKDMDEWCQEKFPSTEPGEVIEKVKTTEDISTNDLVWRNLQIKPTRFERKCLVGVDEIPCYFHGWFQLNTPIKDGNSIAYPVGVVEHRDDGVMEQVKVTSIQFVEVFEE